MESRKLIVLIIVAVISMVDSAKKCPEKYTRFNPNHSFCAERNPKCNIIKEGVDRNEIDVILKLHNKLKSKVATGQEREAGGLPTASNMLQLEWDTELAYIAQNWAAQCKFDHDCRNGCRTVERFRVGQNVAISKTTCSSSECIKANWEKTIEDFYNEVNDYSKHFIGAYTSNSLYGHFTQMIWAKTWKIGCGFVTFKEGDWVKRLYVCNYGPVGNVRDAPAYTVGKPCSACPSNSCCGCKLEGPTYPGLCKMGNVSSDTKSASTTNDKSKVTLLECNWKNTNSLCKFRIIGNQPWNLVISPRAESYATVQLKPGDTSRLKVSSYVQPKSPGFCVKVAFRKGPVNAAENDSSKLVLVATTEDESRHRLLTSYSSKKSNTNLFYFPLSKKTKIELRLSVPQKAPEHVFYIEEIVAYDGTCKL